MNFDIKAARNKTNINLFQNKNVLKRYKDGIEIRSSRSEIFCKTSVPKNFKIFSEKGFRRSQESLVREISCEFCGIFKNIYFAEHRLTHICVK